MAPNWGWGGAGEMARSVKAPATKPDDPSKDPGYTWCFEGKSVTLICCPLVLSPTHTNKQI